METAASLLKTLSAPRRAKVPLWRLVADFTPEQFDITTRIDKAAWSVEMKLHDELFQQLAYHLPAELPATKLKIEARLAAE